MKSLLQEKFLPTIHENTNLWTLEMKRMNLRNVLTKAFNWASTKQCFLDATSKVSISSNPSETRLINSEVIQSLEVLNAVMI